MAYADNYIEYHYHPDLKKILNDNWLFPTYIWNDGSEWYGIKEVQSVVIYKNKIFSYLDYSADFFIVRKEILILYDK